MEKKVAYIANARIPTEKAHGKQIVKTVEALNKFFPTIELWLPNRLQTSHLKNSDMFEFYGIKQHFKVRYFFTFDLLILVTGLPNAIQTIFYALQELSFVAALLMSNSQVDILYSRSLLAAVALKIAARKTVVYEAHNISGSPLPRKIYAPFLRLLDGVVVISHGLESEFKPLGLKKILVAPDGVNLNEFRKVKRRRKQTNRLSIVYVGSLQAGKGVNTLIEAAGFLDGEKYQLSIFGGVFSQVEKESLNRRLSSLRTQNVTVKGYVPPREVPQILKNADILVLPNSAMTNADRKYTSPMKMFEYMASGTPIIASATPANREILNDGKTALFFRPDDPKDLKRAIERLAKGKSLQRRLSSRAQAVVGKFTWNERARKISEFLVSL